MKVSREQAAQNRARVVETAARLFREKGFDGIGVADLMQAASLTHGGFYKHFESKEALLAEACAGIMDEWTGNWRAAVEEDPGKALAKLSGDYLSGEHRDRPGQGCAVAALGADAARLGPAVREALGEGALAQIAVLAEAVGDGTPEDRRRRAITAYAAMIGGIVLARAIHDPAASEEILAAVAQAVRAA
ncbi:TetR/AcrR family transcriptional regulator [Massilia niastensis]|uniref:TetR/AcrR family transcriptional regulator n=1 Tax=Massilia niastensis TaxID=544911 RepID=UPI000367AC61|nr:TetR/AcrR family transcriptional regulator [Massilia niastensis]